MSQQYSLIMVNNSSKSGHLAVYQHDPDLLDSSVLSLAWLSKYAHPNGKVHYKWTISYSFVWSETGKLAPGVMFTASEEKPADLVNSNKIRFEREKGAFRFADQKKDGKEGSLYIETNSSIPENKASVGIGMSGHGTFVRQADPNHVYAFTPKLKYFALFGNYEQGEVLDVSSFVKPLAEIKFPPQVFSMTAILNPDFTWTVKPTALVNEAYLEQKETDANAAWGSLQTVQAA